MIWIVVETDDNVFAASMRQVTTVPFKPILTESIDRVVFRAEILMKVKVVELTTNDSDS